MTLGRVPKEKAMPGVHAAAHRLLARLPRGSLLDLGAGQGALSYWASDAGFETTAVDNNPSDFVASGIAFVEADLNRTVPLPDASTDIVVALEVIEHLENAYAFLREVARLLKPGGQAIISTPNESNLHSRWTYFVTGFFSDASYVMRVPDPGDHYNPHVNCVPFPTLEYAWRRAGLELVEFESSRTRSAACLLWPVMAPLQRLKLALRRRKPKHADRNTELATYRLMNSWQILTGRINVFQLRKPLTASSVLSRAA